MGKFITSSNDEYWNEKDRREKIYKKACEESKKACETYKKSNTLENIKHMNACIRNLDITYIEWMDNVIFENKENL